MNDRRRGQSVPCPQGNNVPLCRWLEVAPGQSVKFIFSSACLYGLMIHWATGSSKACTAHLGECLLCPVSDALWYGFANGWIVGNRTPHIVSVPELAYQNSPTIREHDGRLTGKVFQISREGDKKNGHLNVGQCEDKILSRYPELPPIRFYLEKRYRIMLD